MEIAVVVSNHDREIDIIEQIDAIKKAGFKNVFIQWYNKEWKISQEEQLKYIREQELNVVFAHLGYQNINNLWIEGEEGDSLIDRYKNDIKICKENNINLVIMHLQSKSVAPEYNEIGLERLQKIVDYAQELNVKVAFENTKIRGHFEYTMENIGNENVGICFDSGHYHAFFNDELDFSKYKDRIFALHLHDNDSSGDQHLIPFDGTLDWKSVMKNLRDNNYKGPITMEIVYSEKYFNMGMEEFYKKGYEVGQKLKEMFENAK